MLYMYIYKFHTYRQSRESTISKVTGNMLIYPVQLSCVTSKLYFNKGRASANMTLIQSFAFLTLYNQSI